MTAVHSWTSNARTRGRSDSNETQGPRPRPTGGAEDRTRTGPGNALNVYLNTPLSILQDERAGRRGGSCGVKRIHVE